MARRGPHFAILSDALPNASRRTPPPCSMLNVSPAICTPLFPSKTLTESATSFSGSTRRTADQKMLKAWSFATAWDMPGDADIEREEGVRLYPRVTPVMGGHAPRHGAQMQHLHMEGGQIFGGSQRSRTGISWRTWC